MTSFTAQTLICRLTFASLLGILGAIPGTAAAGAEEPSVPTAPPTPAAGNNPQAAPQAIEKLSVLEWGAIKDQPLDFEMGDVIDIRVSPGGLAALRSAAVTHNKNLGLFLNGHFQTDVLPRAVGADEITFEPLRSDTNKTFWNEVMGGRLFQPRKLAVAIGLEDASVLVPASDNLTIRPLRDIKDWMLLAGGAFLVGIAVWLGAWRGMFRDAGKPANGGDPTYSLGRTQMAFWFVNIVVAVLVVWAVTGSVPLITNSVLALMGIGAGTALGAALIDQSSDGTVPGPSKGFLKDILTDSGSIALHRFQIFVWTIVLGFLFWGSVYNHLALPDFDTTLLALVGISSGAYAGFKFQENQAK